MEDTGVKETNGIPESGSEPIKQESGEGDAEIHSSEPIKQVNNIKEEDKDGTEVTNSGDEKKKEGKREFRGRRRDRLLEEAKNSTEVTKWTIRRKIWEYLEKNNLVDFPRPAYHRIPNFKGAVEAASKLPTLDAFKKAQTVKVAPDKPQEHCRFLTLEAHKNLLVPTPRLRRGLFNKITPPEDPSKADLKRCATSQGVREFSKPLDLEDKIKVDLVVIGSVAVSREGFRIGKGEGYSDIEFAMMATMGAITPDTIVVTTVHDCQITEIPENILEDYDNPVDIILTPTETIMCPSRPKPGGIIWSKLTQEKVNQIPVLKKLRYMEHKQGRDVRLKDQDEVGEVSDTELPEDDDFDPRRRDFQRRRQRFRRERKTSSGKESGKDSEGEGKKSGGEGGEEGQKRKFNRRRRQQRRERKSTSGEGDTESGREKEEEGEVEGEGDRRRRNRRRRRSQRDASEGEEGEHGREGQGRPARGPRSPGQRRGQRGPRMPAVYVGSLPRSLRVSEFKSRVRELKVEPLRVIWHGGSGHAFLQFEKSNEAEDALTALEGLTLNGKEVKVEMSNNTRGRKKFDSQSEPHNQDNSEAEVINSKEAQAVEA